MKLHKFFCNANSKQGLANWLHAFINLLDSVNLSFRKLHHFMLSENCMSTHFPTTHPQFGGNILYHSMLSLNFCQFAWWETGCCPLTLPIFPWFICLWSCLWCSKLCSFFHLPAFINIFLYRTKKPQGSAVWVSPNCPIQIAPIFASVCWERLKAEEKRMTEGEMIGWRHQLNGPELRRFQ